MTTDSTGDEGAADRWNRRYAGERSAHRRGTDKPGESAAPAAAAVLHDNARHLPAGGVALDLACGLGGNAVWLVEQGFAVSAWDISSVAIESLQERAGSPRLQAEVRDVVAEPPEPDSFDVIVVSRFLDRGLCPALQAALRIGGTLFYQSFTHGLSNPDYLLAENELLQLFPDLSVLWYHEPEPVVGPDGKVRAEAGLVAQRVE